MPLDNLSEPKPIMKTEEEIRVEIETLNRADESLRTSYKNNEIPKNVFRSELLMNSSMRVALRWVLGENDRYD